MNVELKRRGEGSPPLRRFGEPPPLQPAPSDFDPLALVLILRRRFKTILVTAALVFAVILPLILQTEPRYHAAMRVLVETPFAAKLQDPVDERISRLNPVTEIERLRARNVAVAVIAELGLDRTDEFNPALREPSPLELAKAFLRRLAAKSPADESEGDALEPVLAEFAAALGIMRDPTSGVVTIGFTSRDRGIAAAAPRTLLAAYMGERESHLQIQIDDATLWLKARMAEQEARAEAAERAARAAEDERWRSSRVWELREKITVMTEQRAAAALRRAELSASLAALDGARATGSETAAVDEPSVAGLRIELRRLLLERERLSRVFGDRYPAVRDTDGAIEDMRDRIAAEVERYRDGIVSAQAALERSDRAASSDIAAAQEALSREEREESQRQELRERANRHMATLDALQERLQSLEASRKLSFADVEVLEPASLPLSPTGRSKVVYAVAALIGSLMIGATVAGVLEALDRSVRSLQQLVGVEGLVLAAMIPRIPTRIARELPLRLDVHGDGAFQQAVRVLALALEQVSGGRPPQSVLVTSPAPEEGKTLVAAALALELAASSGRRVLLVDADLRRGRVHRLFDAAAGPGLAEALSDACSLDAVVRKSAVAGLDYIARGALETAVQSDDLCQRIVDFAAPIYDVVVIDGLPVLASARALSLARDVDRVVLVTRWGRTRLSSVELAAERLRVVLRKEALAAVNGVNPDRHSLYGFRDSDLFARALRKYQRERRA
jgi:uncharacterized protein involved in exopolysaccharide biosynthesis